MDSQGDSYHGSLESALMNLRITQENLYLILPGKVSKMAVMYAEEAGISINEALKQIYQSNTYRKLENEQSKLWHYDPVALYQMFREQH